MVKPKKVMLVALVLLALGVIASTQVTLFAVQPIGAVPEGRTLVILRLTNGKFVDSADAMCERIQGSINLLCRGLVLGQVAQNAKILLRLPYSHAIYLMSTGGKAYDR